MDTTLVSPLHGDGTARRNAATTSGVALRDARTAKERTYPELSGEERGPGWLCWRPQWEVVRGNSTVPRSSVEGQGARVSPALAGSSHSSIRETLERFVGVQAGKVLSLLEQRLVPSVGVDAPSVHDVLRDARFV